mmetsp:Transcript_16871/g.39218  ORF Transcript_16871/g.39218 Transcript_16871/m.39218 type:complete len:624 (+) Transcript_16871:112-1983(+)
MSDDAGWGRHADEAVSFSSDDEDTYLQQATSAIRAATSTWPNGPHYRRTSANTEATVEDGGGDTLRGAEQRHEPDGTESATPAWKDQFEPPMRKPKSLLEVRTFLDLQEYKLDGLVIKPPSAPGSLQLMYMFYSRIYEKLVGKQRGVDVPLYEPFNHDERMMNFRGVLAWASDFKIVPMRVGRRELERIFATVHPGPESPRSRFTGKITYGEFLDLVLLCADVQPGEPMDKSRIDGSRVRTHETRLERVKRLAKYLVLTDSKKVRLNLHNAYRDTHFWKLSNEADFAKEARSTELRAQPQWNVDLLREDRRIDPMLDRGCRKFLDQFTWLSADRTWEEYEGPFVDMGTSVIGSSAKNFRVVLHNRALYLARIQLKAYDLGPLDVPSQDLELGAGQDVEVLIKLVPSEVGSWAGKLAVSSTWFGHHREQTLEEVDIPVLLQVVQHLPAGQHADALPLHAPRPFPAGSRCRAPLDLASITNTQLWVSTPGRVSRPSSATSTKPTETPMSRPWSGHSCGSKAVGRLPPPMPCVTSASPKTTARSKPPLVFKQATLSMQRRPRSASAGPSAAMRGAEGDTRRPHSASRREECEAPRPHSASRGGHLRFAQIAAATAAAGYASAVTAA